jgi:alkane 1-monooxygenase
MPAATTIARPSPLATARIWVLHLLCFVLPVTCVLFLATAPHDAAGALPWLLVLLGSVVADVWSPGERRQPAPALPGWPFDSVLYALAAIQLTVVALWVLMVATHGFWRIDTLVGLLLVGVNSGYSGIVVAHELVHRPQGRLQLLGRLLLGSVLYEHFFTEHIRGHHSRVGTAEDPATAQFGERAGLFFLRTVPAQLLSAWRIECKRLGDAHMRWWDRRLLQSRVVHGLAAEWALAFAILLWLGAGAFAAFLLQALVAVWLLEMVNYFEHWGLARTTRRVQTVDSWDTDSWFTLYTLVGLSRHADHPATASRPYQQLRFFDDSPKLPYGYFGSALMAMFRNARFRELLEAELRNRQLGPFAPDAR